MALRKWFPLLVVSQRVVGVGFFPHGWAGYAPKAGALPTALHPDMKLWGGPGVFSQKRFSAFFIVVYSNLSSFLLQPSYFLAILFPLFPCIPALSVVLHVVSGKVSARIPAPQ